MKGRSVEHAIEQRLSNEILSGFKWFNLIWKALHVTTAKWKVYNDCTVQTNISYKVKPIHELSISLSKRRRHF